MSVCIHSPLKIADLEQLHFNYCKFLSCVPYFNIYDQMKRKSRILDFG